MTQTERYDVEKLKQRDQRACSSFYQKRVRLFYQFAFRFLDDEEVVRDVVQEAFLALWDRMDRFQNEEQIKAFLYTTIRNRALNYIRDRQVEKKNQALMMQLQDEVSFRDVVVEEEMYAFLCSKIELLPPMQREVLWMHVDGWSNEEIARKLNITVNTVLTHKQRAKRVLRNYFPDTFLSFLFL